LSGQNLGGVVWKSSDWLPDKTVRGRWCGPNKNLYVPLKDLEGRLLSRTGTRIKVARLVNHERPVRLRRRLETRQRGRKRASRPDEKGVEGTICARKKKGQIVQ